MPATLTVHDEDPAEEICRLAGDLDDIEIFNNQVLIGVYKRDNDEKKEAKTEGGIILPHQVTKEDDYQSKVGLILKLGPKAFVDPNGLWFADQDMDIGDWVVIRASDGWSLKLISKDKRGQKQELLCRMVDDTNVRMKIDSPLGPDRVY